MQDFLKTIIKEAGKLSLQYFDKDIDSWDKGTNDVVTDVDLLVNDFLVKKIREKYPTHKIHTEEMKEDIEGDIYEWVIDPLDGTRNYAAGIPFWCNMIAVLKNGELYMSVIYSPLDDKLFFAKKDEGAFCNDEKINVKTRKQSKFWFGYFHHNKRGVELERFERGWSNLVKADISTLRRMGSMLTACHIARGKMDYFVNNRLHDHDCLPVILICQEAGAIVSDSYGNPWKRGGKDLVIATPDIYDELMKLFESGLDTISISIYDGPQQVEHFKNMIVKLNIPRKKVNLRRRYFEQNNFGLTVSNRAGLINSNKYRDRNEEKITKLPLCGNCYYPFYQMVIDYNGDIIICPHDWEKKSLVGNVSKDHIFNIWKNTKFEKIRNMLSNSNRRFEPCINCDVRGDVMGVENYRTWKGV